MSSDEGELVSPHLPQDSDRGSSVSSELQVKYFPKKKKKDLTYVVSSKVILEPFFYRDIYNESVTVSLSIFSHIRKSMKIYFALL